MGTNNHDFDKSKIIDKEQNISINNDIRITDENNKTDIKYYKNEAMDVTDEVFSDFSEASYVKHRSRVTSRSANTLFLLLRITKRLNVLVWQCMSFLVLLSSVSAYREQRFAIEPQDQVSGV